MLVGEDYVELRDKARAACKAALPARKEPMPEALVEYVDALFRQLLLRRVESMHGIEKSEPVAAWSDGVVRGGLARAFETHGFAEGHNAAFVLADKASNVINAILDNEVGKAPSVL